MFPNRWLDIEEVVELLGDRIWLWKVDVEG